MKMTYRMGWLVSYPFRKIIRIILNSSPVFFTYHTRPKYAEEVKIEPGPSVSSVKKIGLVVQGPLIKKHDFTLESIRLYKRTFNQSVILLSTWEDEDRNYLSRFKAEGIEIILNKKPENPGLANCHYQIVSSHAGLLRAKEIGAEYALKTRTDQRIYAVNIEGFLCNLLRVFPVKKGYRQRERIVATSNNTFKNRLYSLSDMMLFGQIDDLLLFWGADPNPTLDPSGRLVPENYLTSKFLERIGRSLEWTEEDSHRVFAEHFCVIDQITLDIYWPKYESDREHRHLNYKGEGLQQLSFRDWLNLYCRFEDARPPNPRFPS